MKNNSFKELYKKHIEQLTLFVPIVNRVHGDHHPEFNDVKIEFDKLVNKVNDNNYDLLSEFDNLTKITNSYLVPSDTCESYEAVYQMLETLDKEFRKED